MIRLKGILVSVLLMLIAGCVSDVRPLESQLATPNSWDDRHHQYLQEWYKTLHVVFDVPDENDGSGHRKYTLIVDAYFGESILISIEDRPAYTTTGPGYITNHNPYTVLRVRFVNRVYDSPDGFIKHGMNA